MKKLLLLIACGAMVSFVQAASYDWSYDISITEGFKITSVTTHYTEHLILNADTLENNSYLPDNRKTPDTVMGFTQLTLGEDHYSGKASSSQYLNVAYVDATATQTVSYYTEIIYTDAKNNTYTYKTDEASTDLVYAGEDGLNTYLDMFANGTITIKATENVPEPTSGLLLLLGVAGLALKRKRV